MRCLLTAAVLALTCCSAANDDVVMPAQISGDAIPQSLTGRAGDPIRGETLFVDREGGHCVLCHVVDGLDAPFQGNVGPALSDVGVRLDPGQIRLRIVDMSRLSPETVMPPYYRTKGLRQVAAGLEEQPVLKAEDIEDLVAYLAKRGDSHDTAN